MEDITENTVATTDIEGQSSGDVRERDGDGDDKGFQENADKSSHKKPRSEKQIASARRLVELQKERRARGEKVGRQKRPVVADRKSDDYLTRRYDTELLWEFDQLRRDELKKERLGKALDHHFSAFKNELREDLRNEMNTNIRQAFEGPLRSFFNYQEEEDEEENVPEKVPVEEPELPKQEVQDRQSQEPEREQPESGDKPAKPKFANYFSAGASRGKTENTESQRTNRRSFWN